MQNACRRNVWRGSVIGLSMAALVLTAAGTAQGPAAPETVGLSSARLDTLRAVVREYVDAGRIAGTTVLILRHGRVACLEAFGRQDIERNVPMRTDTIFRIASMSKAVTSVAALILVEEGRLLLSDPVSKYLPSFSRTVVATAGRQSGAEAATVPLRRPITVRDLLTHTSGVSYGDGASTARYQAAGLHGWYLADKTEPIGVLMERLAQLPFDAQPGERWLYGYSTDILGAVVEKASGLDLATVFRTRIFEPLRMVDTSFFLPAQKRHRLATVYSVAPNGRIVRAGEGGMGQGDYIEGPRVCFSGGAGLLSTASDYGRFLQMLLNGGQLDGVRVLSPKTVQLMTSNHVGRLYRDDNSLGFGLGFETTEHVGASGRHGTVGTFGWGSAYYSRYWVDPREDLVAILLAQLVPAGGLDLQDKFRSLVYQAIVGE